MVCGHPSDQFHQPGGAGAAQAKEAGHRYAVLELQDVGLDNKACQEAWNAIQEAHPGLPTLLISADQGTRAPSQHERASVGILRRRS